MPVTNSVPVIACVAPPPSPTTLRIDHVKKVTSKRRSPWASTVHSSEISGNRARPKAT